MKTVTVNLLTAEGVIDYPSYREESAQMLDGRNMNEVMFTPCDADTPQHVIAVIYGDGSSDPVTLPVDILLTVGTVIKFAPGTLTEEAATPLVLNGAPYYAQVRARQMVVDLMGTNADYALQAMPEAEDEYAIIYVTGHETSVWHVNEGWDDFGRYYDFNAWAKVSIIRGSPSAMAFLNDLLTILQTRRGYYWQCQRGFDFAVSEEIQNTSPLIDNRSYQQQATVSIKFSFVLRHYEQEGWIKQATVSDKIADNAQVIVTPEGE
ncbi:hypothetical protein D3C81_31870 [compost metagenome]